jgi:hypothetical protein
MLNACQFSAAKSDAESKMLQAFVFDDEGVRKGYSAFKKDAQAATDIINDTWLRTEYDMSVRQAVTGDQFRRYRKDADIYPYWRYLMTTSLHPRDEHLLLVGNVYEIGDPVGDKVVPPGGWNCSCGTEQLSDYDLDNEGISARSSEQCKEDLERVTPQFRFNPADQGILPKESHSYFEALPNANEANGKLFNIEGSPKNQSKMAAKGLHAMVQIFDDFRHHYHSNLHTITFQCPELYTNVIFDQTSFKNISNNPAGFERLGDTIKSPDEVWSRWADVSQQTSVWRNYIRGNYIVSTLNGRVVNAYLVDNIEGYRNGVIVL